MDDFATFLACALGVLVCAIVLYVVLGVWMAIVGAIIGGYWLGGLDSR